MMEVIFENQQIQRMARYFDQPSKRFNKIHEADAELIDLGDASDFCLAITTDSIVEEITSGMYDDPYLIGWMIAMVNFSDIAAVGADPLGLLVSVNYPFHQDKLCSDKLAKGISDACRLLNTFVLGGDTNEGKELNLSGCAAGLVPKQSIITRIGAKAGDRCYLSGPAGIGSVFAFLKLSGEIDPSSHSFYKPVARIREGKIIRKFAHCCMDTSDGVIHTLDTLMRLNRCQFVLYDHWSQILHPMVLEICEAQNIPRWITLAGVHGEFELCFTIDPKIEDAFLHEAEKIGWDPILLGEVREGWGVGIGTEQDIIPIDSGAIRNLSATAGSSYQEYIHHLLKIGQQVDTQLSLKRA